jgi:hypothetical protein
MAPVFLPRVKLAVRSFTLAECRSLAMQCKALDSAAAVRQLMTEQVRVRLERFLGTAEEAPR